MDWRWDKVVSQAKAKVGILVLNLDEGIVGHKIVPAV